MKASERDTRREGAGTGAPAVHACSVPGAGATRSHFICTTARERGSSSSCLLQTRTLRLREVARGHGLGSREGVNSGPAGPGPDSPADALTSRPARAILQHRPQQQRTPYTPLFLQGEESYHQHAIFPREPPPFASTQTKRTRWTSWDRRTHWGTADGTAAAEAYAVRFRFTEH